MATGIFSVTIIANGVIPPIRMTAFPAVKTFEAVRSGNEPDIAGTKIEILVTDKTDVFDTVPCIGLGNHGRLNDDGWRRRYDHWRCNHYRRHIKSHLAIRLNDTAGNQSQPSGREGQEAGTAGTEIFYFAN